MSLRQLAIQWLVSLAGLKDQLQELHERVNEGLWFTMTTHNKAGINPQSPFDTPFGIYCYPLNEEYFSKLVNNKLPFAGERPYVQVLEVTGNILILPNIQQKDIDAIQILEPRSTDLFFGKSGTSLAWEFWKITRLLSNKNIVTWNKILRNLGYDAVYDPNLEIISQTSIHQLVILDPRKYKHVGSYYNPGAQDTPYSEHVPELTTRKSKKPGKKTNVKDAVLDYIKTKDQNILLAFRDSEDDTVNELTEFLRTIKAGRTPFLSVSSDYNYSYIMVFDQACLCREIILNSSFGIHTLKINNGKVDYGNSGLGSLSQESKLFKLIESFKIPKTLEHYLNQKFANKYVYIQNRDLAPTDPNHSSYEKMAS